MVSMLAGAFDWFTDFFMALFDLIPKIMYLLYASAACLIDILQLVFRKLAGLDVYYVDGEAITGDIVSNFITGILGINADGLEYPVLSTVFWAFIVFGLIMLFMTTIVAIVKSHYTYDDKSAKGPMQYVYTAGKAVVNMVAVPIIVVLGLYISQAILTALDAMTSVTSSSVVSLYGNDKVNEYLVSVDTVKSATGKSDEKTYIYYDFFGFGASIAYGPDVESPLLPSKNDLALIGSSNQTFSGSLFRIGAYNANRARIGQYNYNTGNFTGAANDTMTLFGNAQTQEQLADMIDTAFACSLHLQDVYELNYSIAGEFTNDSMFTNWYSKDIAAFSKFNVGAVWYYYDLWQFNFIVAIAALIICLTIFINIIFGLIARLFTCIVLFLIAPPLFGLAPLDGGSAGGKWKSNFIKQVLMAYGAVVGMNLMFLILPYINTIDFFNIAIADILMQTLIIIAGLITIKAIIALVSDLIGGADANATGKDLAAEVGSVTKDAGKMALGAAKVASMPARLALKGTAHAAGKVGGFAAGLGLAGLDAVKDSKFGQFVGKKTNDLKEGASNKLNKIKDSKLAKATSVATGFLKDPRMKIAEAREKSNEKKFFKRAEEKEEDKLAYKEHKNRQSARNNAFGALTNTEKLDRLHKTTDSKERRRLGKEMYEDAEGELIRGGYSKRQAKMWTKKVKKEGGIDSLDPTKATLSSIAKFKKDIDSSYKSMMLGDALKKHNQENKAISRSQIAHDQANRLKLSRMQREQRKHPPQDDDGDGSGDGSGSGGGSRNPTASQRQAEDKRQNEEISKDIKKQLKEMTNSMFKYVGGIINRASRSDADSSGTIRRGRGYGD